MVLREGGAGDDPVALLGEEMRRARKGGQFEEFGGMVVVKGGVMNRPIMPFFKVREKCRVLAAAFGVIESFPTTLPPSASMALARAQWCLCPTVSVHQPARGLGAATIGALPLPSSIHWRVDSAMRS